MLLYHLKGDNNMNKSNTLLKNLEFKYLCLSKQLVQNLIHHDKKQTDDIIDYCLKRHALLKNANKNKRNIFYDC